MDFGDYNGWAANRRIGAGMKPERDAKEARWNR